MWEWLKPRWLKRLEAKVDQIMSSVNDLKPILDAIGVDAATASTGVTSLLAKLTALQGAGTLNAADQATLDAAVGEATTLKGAMDALATAANPPAAGA